MKCLKIENGQGHFSLDGGNWNPLDKITKDDILQIIDTGIESSFEMDDFNELTIKNMAHEIIYRNLYTKLNELNSDRKRFKDEGEKYFKEAFEKYS